MTFREQLLKKIIKVAFPDNEYVKEYTPKDKLVLHHNAGADSMINMFHGWSVDNLGRVATHFGINRNGDIYQGYSTDYWASAIYLNSKGSTPKPSLVKYKTGAQDRLINRSAVQLEISSFGFLKKVGDKYFAWPKNFTLEIPADQVIELNYRGFQYYHKYTQEQIDAIELIARYLNETRGLDLTYHPDMFEVNENAMSGQKGIWSHTSYRTDKTDLFPQPELVAMLKKLGGVK